MGHKFKPLDIKTLDGEVIRKITAFSAGRMLEAIIVLDNHSEQRVLFEIYNGKKLLYRGPHLQLAVDVYNDLTRTEQLFPEEATFAGSLEAQSSRPVRPKRRYKLL